jgi:hypothetical protein
MKGHFPMKHLIAFLMLGALVASTGCGAKDTSGGPGAALPPAKQATIGQTDDTFSLDTPMMSTSLAQGEAKAFTIAIKRGKNIDQDVTLNFSDLPKGVTIDPASPVIKHGDLDAKLTLNATGDAALGDFTVKVLGHPTTGPDATSDLKITVEKT